jgi:uncharacterized protein (TIGR03067 family)
MISRLAVFAAGLVFASISLADEKAPTLDGKWKVVKAEMGGEDLPVDRAPIRQFEFNAKQAKLSEALFGKVEMKEYKLKLDLKATPMAMDIGEGGTGKDCIYKFEKDNLIIALVSKQFRKRPTEFKTTKGDSFIVFTLERDK